MIEVHFSPHGSIAPRVATEILTAKTAVRIMAYTFTDKVICYAICEKANISTFIQDAKASLGKGSLASTLYKNKVNCYLDHIHVIAHNKVIIIDERLLITGSYNFTNAAENVNAENLLIIDDPVVIAQYISNFNLHLSHSTPYDPTKAKLLTAPFDTEFTQT